MINIKKTLAKLIIGKKIINKKITMDDLFAIVDSREKKKIKNIFRNFFCVQESDIVSEMLASKKKKDREFIKKRRVVSFRK